MRACIFFLLLITAVSAQNTRFPAIPAAVNGFNQSQAKWQVVSRHRIAGLDGTVYSFKFLPNGTQAVVASACTSLICRQIAWCGVSVTA